MRVLHFIPVYKPAWQYGGPVRSVSTLCESLAECGDQVVVATTNAGMGGQNGIARKLNQPLDVDGVKVFYYPRDPVPTYIESISLRRHVYELAANADLVHVSGVWQPLTLSVTRAAQLAGKPYICSLRGTVNPWAWSHRTYKHKLYWYLIESKQLAHASALHVTSETEREDAVTYKVGSGQKIIVVPNSIKCSEFVRDEQLAWDFRNSIPLSKHQKLILYFGRLHEKKGIDLFLYAAADVLRNTDEWKFLIVGPSEQGYGDKLKVLVQALGLTNSVLFLDLIQGRDRLAVLSAADLFVLTSHNENFGMSVVEAMAASAPVLISESVGISKEIVADKAGCVTKLDIESIRSELVGLMKSDDLRSFYAARGCSTARSRYDRSSVANLMRSAYADVRLDYAHV
jgi:glycosyltransferase involved in cell wall biosynthesis